jgi:hypothetical protein
MFFYSFKIENKIIKEVQSIGALKNKIFLNFLYSSPPHSLSLSLSLIKQQKKIINKSNLFVNNATKSYDSKINDACIIRD